MPMSIHRSAPGLLPGFLENPKSFVAHYLRLDWLRYGMLAGGALGGASAAVAVQCTIKILVDAIGGPRGNNDVWIALALFMLLIAAESVLWRFCGWLACRATVDAGVRMRVDLFEYLAGQP